jgi:hypothetical protein
MGWVMIWVAKRIEKAEIAVNPKTNSEVFGFAILIS